METPTGKSHFRHRQIPMKNHFKFFLFAALFCSFALFAADEPSDLATIRDAQEEALSKARQQLERTENPRAKNTLQTAIDAMEHARAALEKAKDTPAEFSAALAAEQTAYQALLKMIPHDFQVSNSRSRSRGGRAGQPSRGQLDQLEMTSEENRYETERQATAAPQLQIADRLKTLAQRQQDLNDRLRELQTALQGARNDAQREDIRRQLKRLQDEERQMLADVDEVRQQLEQSPNAASTSQARQQLEQTRSDTQRAAEEIGQESVSQALASGTRAQQGLQSLREDLRRQTSSQFSEQMRQLRSQARDLDKQEAEIARGLESLAHPEQKTLDDEAQRQQLTQQMARQQSGLTNLLGGMEKLSDQAESTEPLLAQQLYDTLRRASQMHTDNLLDIGGQLVRRGLLSQAAGPEKTARQNIGELRQRVEHAAESILGNETEALRYAQKELDDLSAQVEKDAADASATNNFGQATNAATGSGNSNGQNANATGQNPSAKSRAASATGQNANATGQKVNAGSESANASAQNGKTPGRDGNGAVQNGNGTGQQEASGAADASGNGNGENSGGMDRLRQMVQQLGGASTGGGGGGGGAHGVGGRNGPVTGNDYSSWTERVRDVEQVLEAPDMRNQLAAARERIGAFRADFRRTGQKPDPQAVRAQVLQPMTEVRAWLHDELARREDANSLVPLDHDPVPDAYSDLVRQYYEKLGGGQ
jgi:hypothetical protein